MTNLTPLIDYHMNYHTTKRDVNIHYSNLKITTQTLLLRPSHMKFFPRLIHPKVSVLTYGRNGNKI